MTRCVLGAGVLAKPGVDAEEDKRVTNSHNGCLVRGDQGEIFFEILNANSCFLAPYC